MLSKSKIKWYLYKIAKTFYKNNKIKGEGYSDLLKKFSNNLVEISLTLKKIYLEYLDFFKNWYLNKKHSLVRFSF